MSFWRFKPYVSVGQRRAKANRKRTQLAKQGQVVCPVEVHGRAIATTFWGKSWCEHLEAYSDYANRLPRGRTYVRNGSVIHLQIEGGRVSALVSGTEVYEVEITVSPLKKAAWERVRSRCGGQIGSLVELLQGRLSQEVMQIVTHRDEGLFPKPNEISMNCTCPDWAGMCKHVAATLFGVGARLDHQPELLFVLRQVDHRKLVDGVRQIAKFGKARQRGAEKELAAGDLPEIFGIELEGAAPTTVRSAPGAQRGDSKSRTARLPAAVAAPKRVGRDRAVKRPGRAAGDTATAGDGGIARGRAARRKPAAPAADSARRKSPRTATKKRGRQGKGRPKS